MRGEAAGAGDREAEEDDVAGHVRDEHVAELEVADGIDETGEERECHRHRHEWRVSVAGGRPEQLGDVAQDAHRCGREFAFAGRLAGVLTRQECQLSETARAGTPRRAQRAASTVSRSAALAS